ncbi:MAG: hypothetical protein C4K47_01940 [Candidatus Thorarchaeota archaeon]|nr:MAG: hypothetical protein C4K47_01940 [Candidatus Thorarchaeota archaeon]
MKVEIDVSELEWGHWYKDEKCKAMERVLQSDPRYAECEVRRARWEKEGIDDPFYVLDKDEREIIMLKKWEVYALGDSDFISYVNLQTKRNRLSDRTTAAVYVLFLLPVGFALSCAIAAAVVQYLGEYESFSILMGLVVLSSALLLFAGPLAYLLHRYTESRMRNMDLEAAGKDTSFVDSLRRVAEAAEADKYKRKELVKRVKQLEDALAGINS